MAHGKPEPDVFIYAAGWMRTPIRGLRGGRGQPPRGPRRPGAGLRVFGFVGGSHCAPGHRDRLLEAGAEAVLEIFHELESVLPPRSEAGRNGAASRAAPGCVVEEAR